MKKEQGAKRKSIEKFLTISPLPKEPGGRDQGLHINF
jgi:hypothetical protein